MHFSGSRSPCSHICTGDLKYNINRSIFVTSGRTLDNADGTLEYREPRLKTIALDTQSVIL